MTPYRIFIVEDELLIAEMLSDYLQTLGYSVCGIVSDVDAAVEYLQTQDKPDLVFVDINLESDKSGFDLAELLVTQYQVPYVFLTSYADINTMSRAVGMGPEAYLLKPFKSADIFTTVEIIRNRKKWQQNSDKAIVVKDGSQSVKLVIKDILWLKSDNVYVEVQMTDRKLLLRKSMEGLLAELEAPNMVRTHRSYAVNIFHLSSVSGSTLRIGAHEIPVSRAHKEELIEKFRNLSQ